MIKIRQKKYILHIIEEFSPEKIALKLEEFLINNKEVFFGVQVGLQ